jgi:uncharacterized FlgJ-related protein
MKHSELDDRTGSQQKHSKKVAKKSKVKRPVTSRKKTPVDKLLKSSESKKQIHLTKLLNQIENTDSKVTRSKQKKLQKQYIGKSTSQEKVNMWDISEDSVRNLVTRSSTWSLPYTEISKRMYNFNMSHNNMDLSSQRNLENYETQRVFAIIEDEKEENSLKENRCTNQKKKLYSEFDADHRGQKKYHKDKGSLSSV